MARCTAPVRGHSSAAAAAACPACRNRSGYRRSSYSYDSYPSYSSSGSAGGSRGSSSGGSSSGTKPRWSKSGSSVSYTTAQVQSLTPIRQTVEKLVAEKPDLRDVFLCH
ncbi:TPA: TIR domain protein, partial [Klebsiella pneumoniae]|nr:TIR domain protein [Klebsiella pneumoniae]